MPRYVVSHLLGFLGAVIGGALGFYIFGWFARHGFYGLMIPGALLGGGCGLLARHSSPARGVICAVGAALLALFTEWRYFPFLADTSASYFVEHLSSLSPVTWIMVVFGALIAYWLGRDAGFGGLWPASGRSDPVSKQRSQSEV